MRDLYEIQQANKEFEEREKAGDFDKDNRCIECGEKVEDCECRIERFDGDGLEGVDLDG